MDFKKTLLDSTKNKVGKVLLNPINNIVDDNLTEITTTIGSFIVRSIRGKFQRSISFTIGLSYADSWMEEALYGILYKYNDIKSGSRLELTNKKGFGDGSAMYYRLDDGTHNLKYRKYNILLVIQTNCPSSMTGRISVQRIYTIITYDLSPQFVKDFEADMIRHRNDILKIRADSATVNVYQDLHEGDGYTYWERTGIINKRRIGTIYLQREVKEKIVNTINEFFANREYYQKHGIAHNLKILLYGPPGPQPVSVTIPTPDGIRRFGDIKPGDYVFGLNGNPTLVEEVYEYKDLDVYKVIFDDGREVLCGVDHKWPIISDDGSFTEMNTDSLMADGLKNRNGDYKFRIPIGDEVVFPSKDVPLNPWVVGALIGNHGTRFMYTISFLSHDEKFIKSLSDETGLSCITTGNGIRVLAYENTPGAEVDANEFLKDVPELLQLRSSEEDYIIPQDYLYNSREVRYALLQGMMDASGFVEDWVNSGTVKYSTDNFMLARQFVFLVRSLGFKVHCDESNDVHPEKYKAVMTIYCGDRQRHLFFRNSTNSYQAMVTKFMPKNSIVQGATSLSIVGIKKLEYKEDMHCLHVQDGRHLYQTTNFVMTCNTGKDSIAKMIASEWNRNLYYVTGGKNGNFISNALVDNGSDVNFPLFLISDIDKYPFLINEPEVNMEKESSNKDEQLRYKQLFGGMINALDGVLSGEGRIIIMTTNHIEKFSDVLLRPGRIDLKLEIGYVTPEVFRKYVLDFYHKELPSDIKLKNDKLTVANMQFDVVFLKLTADEFIAKYVKQEESK